MTARCCVCGRPVPQRLVAGEWIPGRCKLHPNAKRYSDGFAARWFRRMSDVVNGELAEQIAALRDVRKPYLPVSVETLLHVVRQSLKGGAS